MVPKVSNQSDEPPRFRQYAVEGLSHRLLQLAETGARDARGLPMRRGSGRS